MLRVGASGIALIAGTQESHVLTSLLAPPQWAARCWEGGMAMGVGCGSVRAVAALRLSLLCDAQCAWVNSHALSERPCGRSAPSRMGCLRHKLAVPIQRDVPTHAPGSASLGGWRGRILGWCGPVGPVAAVCQGMLCDAQCAWVSSHAWSERPYGHSATSWKVGTAWEVGTSLLPIVKTEEAMG